MLPTPQPCTMRRANSQGEHPGRASQVEHPRLACSPQSLSSRHSDAALWKSGFGGQRIDKAVSTLSSLSTGVFGISSVFSNKPSRSVVTTTQCPCGTAPSHIMDDTVSHCTRCRQPAPDLFVTWTVFPPRPLVLCCIWSLARGAEAGHGASAIVAKRTRKNPPPPLYVVLRAANEPPG